MRQFFFKFRRGNWIQICPGVEFASPMNGEDRKEECIVIGHNAIKDKNRWIKSYLVKGLRTKRKYYLDEPFVKKIERKDVIQNAEAGDE